MKMLLALAVVLCLGCITDKATFTLSDDGNPTVSLERQNVMRVGNGILIVVVTGDEARITRTTSEDAMSAELRAAWADLNRTIQMAIIGAAAGTIVSPGVGTVVGGVGGGVVGAVVDEITEEVTEP